ncbi:extracellular solute-binding protein [Magnetococcales bacterium HHB-1]
MAFFPPSQKFLPARLLVLFSLFFIAWPVAAEHGHSLDGPLKYPKTFKQFDYVSSKAKVGGTLALHSIGTFDKMNPFTLKGSAPDLLSSLLFETLTTESLDEPFAQYGLLAEDVENAEDGLSVTFTLNAKAQFSDGSPITAEDVQFSLNLLQSEKAHPLYQTYWRDIDRSEILSPRKIRFHFKRKNRELGMLSGQLPVLSKTYWSKNDFIKSGLKVPLGSGPYIVDRFDPGKVIIYKRNPDYWGWHLPVRRGQYNFERIVIKYFKDDVVALEAFKAGEFDFIDVNHSKQWARDYVGPRFDNGTLIKTTLKHKNGSGMQGFVFNLRRKKFQDILVRKAITLAFDFEWSNKNLFYDQYARADSYFSNSELAATGKPSKEELALLEPFRNRLDPAVFQPVKAPPSTKPPHSIRKNLRQAMQLLKKAGWRIDKKRQLVDQKGKPFTIDVVLVMPAFERILAPFAANLKRLGIQLNYRTVDASLYLHRLKSFDFDMVVALFGQSQSPGNEQRNMWHSSSADKQGSRNYIGLKDPIIDALVEKIIYAENRQQLVTACRAFDRVMMARHYVVPNWHIPYHRISYNKKLQRPQMVPLYFQPSQWLMSWWYENP